MVILINGHPNSGKTTLRDGLKETLVERSFEAIDFDGSLLASANKYKPSSREEFRKLKRGVIRNMIQYMSDKNAIIDVLFTNQEFESFSRALESYGQQTFCVRLFCSDTLRRSRDERRHLQNPDAPVGFNDVMNPDANSELYNLEIDTTDLSPEDVVNLIINTLF